MMCDRIENESPESLPHSKAYVEGETNIRGRHCKCEESEDDEGDEDDEDDEDCGDVDEFAYASDDCSKEPAEVDSRDERKSVLFSQKTNRTTQV